MRPIEHLPIPFPKDYDPGVNDPSYFYNNFAKHFVPDMIQMMNTGLTIDQDAVEDLRTTVEEVLHSVDERLSKSKLIKEFQKSILPAAQKAHYEKCTESIRTIDYYIKPYKSGDMLHRTWVVNTYLESIYREGDKKDKWDVKTLKQYNIFLEDKFLNAIIEKRDLRNNNVVKEAMLKLAEYKLELWNRPRYDKAKVPVKLKAFNPGSSKQVKEFFEFLEIEPLASSAQTGEASWGRDQLEILLKQDPEEELKEVLIAMVDYSYGNIIKTNFIKAFDTFTVDGVLHGNIKLFGAKSFRNTSNSPNLLNAPSTRSIYAKPLKKCFIAPKGKVVYTADLSALEDRVIANLSQDKNKCNIFLEGLDGHSLNACGYFIEDLKKIMEGDPTSVENIKKFFELADSGTQPYKDLRQKSKGPTFKLAYGGYPDDYKGGVITQEIFDNYHNVLYPGITDYRENYVLPFTHDHGYIHLGLGCRLYSSTADQHIRTLHNATVQFWSILTLIAINEFNHRVREAQLTEEIQVTSTIYDSIYTQVERDPEIIKWTNDNLIELMCVQYLEDEIVHNEAEGEIGLNWADLHKIKNNASIEDIAAVLKEL